LSYLLALKARGKKAVIATFTKALQDQLLSKDVPILHKPRHDFVYISAE